LKPLHENAMLGRAVALTYLQRHDEAITAATRMIDLRTANVHEAYYWRAWNLHFRKELPAARADIDRAKALASTGDIHRLAGVIEHDQNDLDVAERDLETAKRPLLGGRTDCIARWYLGLVGMKRARWAEAAVHFEDAKDCYAITTAALASKLAVTVENTTLDPEFKARLVERLTAAIKEGQSQFHAAAFNAANNFAAAGNLEKARPLLEVAAKDPALDKFVADLRRRMGGPPRVRKRRAVSDRI
jgi:tetratricopeptide (TPR) repeat protein